MIKQVFRELEISSIKTETENSSRIRFDIPKALTYQFSHKPGQYISVQFDTKKGTHIRTYSISSEPNNKYIEIGVKHIEKGIFSKFLKTKKLETKYYYLTQKVNFFLPEKIQKSYFL